MDLPVTRYATTVDGVHIAYQGAFPIAGTSTEP